jgi:hypothetical protein
MITVKTAIQRPTRSAFDVKVMIERSGARRCAIAPEQPKTIRRGVRPERAAPFA